MEQTIKFIGKIHSALKKIEECSLQENENAPEAILQIFSRVYGRYQGHKAGLGNLIINLATYDCRRVIKCKPRNNPRSPLIGIFSTRSPDRPNPIGFHIVKVLSISDNDLIKFSGGSYRSNSCD